LGASWLSSQIIVIFSRGSCNLQRFSSDLAQNEMRPLSHICRTHSYLCSLQFGLAKNLYCRRGLFWIAKGIAHIFHPTGNTNATFEV
jgi:hypothetical protein